MTCDRGSRRAALLSLLASPLTANAQEPDERRLPIPRNPEEDTRLPNGKSQKDEIIRVDYERNLKDAAELARLSEQIKDDLEKGDRYLVSLKTLKELEDVEKLAKVIRQRLRRN
jgi:hypothetical protein